MSTSRANEISPVSQSLSNATIMTKGAVLDLQYAVEHLRKTPHVATCRLAESVLAQSRDLLRLIADLRSKVAAHSRIDAAVSEVSS